MGEIKPTVFCQEEVCSEEKKVDRRVKDVLKDVNGKLITVWGSTLYSPSDLPFSIDGLPDVFTPFRNKVEKFCNIGMPLAVPGRTSLSLPGGEILTTMDKLSSCSGFNYMPTLDELGYDTSEIQKIMMPDVRSVLKFRGGEKAGLERLNNYIWTKDLLKDYFDTRNGMLGGDYSSKFSPWLAHGNLSPRYIAQQCTLYEQKRIANKSTYWLVFELLWRDFFKFFAQKHGNDIFKLDGTLGRLAHGTHPNSRRWSLDKRHLNAWKNGMTGYPLVDANMRELKETGYMSNRGRQNVCSFLAIDMKTDWRYGADHFETELIDHDVHSNWGNWCAGAGMTGGRLNRFNIVRQGQNYDQNGDYVRVWCPELKGLPDEFIHQPWKMSQSQQEEFNVKIGRDYPKPIIAPFAPTNGNEKNWKNSGGGKKGKKMKNGKYQMKSLKQGSYRLQ